MTIDRSSKRMLTLCYEYPPLGGGGGKVAKGLIDRLGPMGFHVDWITMQLPASALPQPVPHLTVHQINAQRRDTIVCAAGEMVPYVVRSLLKALRLVRARHYDFNLSHFLFPDGLVCLAVKKLTGLPYVITAHGSDVPGYNPHRFQLLHRLLRPFWRTVARNAASIVCPSLVVQQLIQKECPEAQTVVIPNGIDPERFVADRPKQERILAVSRIVERKGVQYLIEALAGLDRRFELHVVGDGPYLPTLRALAATRGVEVIFHGALANDSPQLKELYETSRIFAFVSTMENFPLVLLEAMTAGCAIVTTAGTGCAEVVGEDAILVAPGDVVATREALVRLTNDPDLCRRLGQQARTRVETRYSWQIVVARYLQILEATARPQPVHNGLAVKHLHAPAGAPPS